MKNFEIEKALEKAKEEYNQAKLEYLEVQYQAEQASKQAETAVKQAHDQLLAKASVLNFLDQATQENKVEDHGQKNSTKL